MWTITMTELNQRVSAVTRQVVETGEAVQVTNRGKVVLRLVPEPQNSPDPLDALIAAGLAVAPRRAPQVDLPSEPIALSGDIDEVLAEINGDRDV